MPELITTFFSSEEYEHWVIGGAAVSAMITITAMVIILIRLFRKKQPETGPVFSDLLKYVSLLIALPAAHSDFNMLA